MAGWLIDTSVLVDAERGVAGLARVPADGEHLISVITLSELLHGVHRAPHGPLRARRQAFVDAVVAGIEALPITGDVARVHAELWSALDAAGEAIGAHDLWIAATALAHELTVATANAREFSRVPGLDVLVP